MTVKLWNISDWSPVTKDALMVLPAPPGREAQSRKVRLEVNASWPTRVTLVRPGHKFFHLAVVDGVETIEFWAEGEIKFSFSSALVGTDEVEAWAYTADGLKTSFEIPDAETFTKIATRRARNPELELIQFKMEQNFQRLLDGQAAEFERRYGADIRTGEVRETRDEPDTKAAIAGDGAGVAPAPDGEQAAPAPVPVTDPPAAKAPETAPAKPADAGPS